MVKHPNQPFVWLVGILNQYDGDLDFLFYRISKLSFLDLLRNQKKFYKDRPPAVLLGNPHNG